MEELLEKIKQCKVCEKYLSLGANPIVSASKKSKIVIIGQAPGLIVHNTGILWNDKSGDNLRKWLGVDKDTFYNPDLFALVPMGFCYPGKGKSGDLPPRPECAPLWHQHLLNYMPDIKLTILIGHYSQNYYLAKQSKNTLTETVQNFKEFVSKYLVLPHPSPRNNIWQSKNKWFEQEVLPYLKDEVSKLISITP